jgi:uncharacterized protein (DUF2164 family)
MAIKLSSETRQTLIASVKRFFAETLEEGIGDLKASLVLDFCVQEIGPSIYNRAIADAQAHMQEKVTDLDGSCFEPEFTYWKRRSGSSRG